MDEIVTLEIPDLPRYLTDILYQYQQGNHLCDCQIITNNGTIPAHSLVLLITCPFFNGTRNFISTQGMNFTVPFNIDDVGTVVRLLYTGKLTVSKNNIEQIVDICHYLQLKEALSLCQKYIQSVPCKEEITDIDHSEERTDIAIGTLNLCQSVARTVDCSVSESTKNEESIDLPPFSNDHTISDEKSNSRSETELYDGVSKTFDKRVFKQASSQYGLDIQDGIRTVSCTKNFTTVHKTGTCNGSMEMYVTSEASQPSEEEGARYSKPDLLHNKEKNVSSQIYDDSHSANVSCVSNGQDAESFKQQKSTFHNVTLNLVSLSSSSSSDLQNRNSSIEGIFRHGENRFENSCGDLNCDFATTCIKKETMDFDVGEFTVNNPVSAERVSECMWNYPYDTGCNTHFTGHNPQFSGNNPQSIWNDPQSTGNIPQSTETDSGLRNFEIQISEPPQRIIAKKVKGRRKGKSEDVIEDENITYIEAPALNKKSTEKQRKKREKELKGQKGIANSDSVKNGRKRKGNQDSEETSVVLNNNEGSVAHKIQTESDTPNAQSVQTEVTTSDKEKEKLETDRFSSVVYRCYICNYMFETKDELIKHRDENHPGKELGRLMYICDICGCTSVWEIHHVNHMYKKHNLPFDKNKYKLLSCHYEGCDYSTLLAFRLKQHIKNVHEFERKFTCETCGKSFKLKESLNAHAVVHKMGPNRVDFVCNICGKDFIRKGTLTKHMEYVHFKKPFTHICHICDKSFQSKMKLVSHLFISHGETPIDYKVHDCDQCDFRCIYPSELRQHKALHQDCEGKLKCRFCDQTFSNKYSFESHEKRHSMAPMKCKFEGCNFSTLYKLSMANHISGKHTNSRSSGIENAKCHICDKTFSTKSNMLKHEKTHGKAKFECGICGKKFHFKSRLMQHLVYHSSDKEFLCAECGSAFLSKSSLLRHENIVHKKVNVFKCSKCPKVFAQQAYLVVHELKHEGKKMFSCPKCNKEFSYKHTLLRHSCKPKKQSDSFECEVCSKAFSSNMALRQHQMKHKEKTYICEKCGAAFTWMSVLKNHRKSCKK